MNYREFLQARLNIPSATSSRSCTQLRCIIVAKAHGGPEEMPTSIEMSALGGSEIEKSIEKVIREVTGPIPGNWHISVVGSQANDVWKLEIRGPQRRSYELYGSDGQHDPRFVRSLLADGLGSPPISPSSLPDTIANAWDRLSRGAGVRADVGAVLDFIAENWSKTADDFAVERKWGRLSIESERRSEALIALEDRAHSKEFDALVAGVVQGALVLDFFGSLDPLPTRLRRAAYLTGYRSATELNRALTLHALSREPRAFINDTLENFPKDPLIDTLHSFLESSNNALKLSSRAEPIGFDKSLAEIVFGVASQAVSEQSQKLRELPADLRAAVGDLANRLVRTLPNEHFGRFVRLRTSIVAIFTVTDKADAEFAKGILLNEPEPAVLEALMLTANLPSLSSLFEQLSVPTGEQRPIYTATLIDLLRTGAPNVISHATDALMSWSKSQSAILSVASEAALLTSKHIDAKEFEQAFLKAAAHPAELEALTQWIATNPGFLEHINLKGLRRGLWRSLVVSTVPIEPRLALSLIQAKLQQTDATRYWQDSIEILATAGTRQSEEMLAELVVQGFERNSKLGERQALSGSAARIVAESQFWNIATRLDEGSRLSLFDAIQEKVGPAQVERLLRSGMNRKGNDRDHDLKAWITNEFVPYLLVKRFASPDVGRTFDELSFKENLAVRLASAVLTDWKYIREFPNLWDSRRKDAKNKLLRRLRGGLQAGLKVRENSPLHAGVERLFASAEMWGESETPAMRPEFMLAASSPLPETLQENRTVLTDYFRQKSRNPHSLALFMAENLWSFRYLFHERQDWPNPDALLESICKSFVFIRNLRDNAFAEIEKMNYLVLVDLGLAIRSILADIEGELAGYFAFRDVLQECGLKGVAPLGSIFNQDLAQSEAGYRLVRDPNSPGRLRVFSTGLRVNDVVVDPATITQSGAQDDRD